MLTRLHNPEFNPYLQRRAIFDVSESGPPPSADEPPSTDKPPATETPEQKLEKETEEIRKKAEDLRDENMEDAPTAEHPAIINYMNEVDTEMAKIDSSKYTKALRDKVRKNLEVNALNKLEEKNQLKYEAAKRAHIETVMKDGLDGIKFNKLNQEKKAYMIALMEGLMEYKVIYPKKNWTENFQKQLSKNKNVIQEAIKKPMIKPPINNPDLGDNESNKSMREDAGQILKNSEIYAYIYGQAVQASAAASGSSDLYKAYRYHMLAIVAKLPQGTTYEDLPKGQIPGFREYAAAHGYTFSDDGKISDKPDPAKNLLATGAGSRAVRNALGIPTNILENDMTTEQKQKIADFQKKLEDPRVKELFETSIMEAAKILGDNKQARAAYKQHLIELIMTDKLNSENIKPPGEFQEGIERTENNEAAVRARTKIRDILRLQHLEIKQRQDMLNDPGFLTPEEKTALTTGADGESKPCRMRGRLYEYGTSTYRAMNVTIETDGTVKVEWKDYSAKEYADIQKARADRVAQRKAAAAAKTAERPGDTPPGQSADKPQEKTPEKNPEQLKKEAKATLKTILRMGSDVTLAARQKMLNDMKRFTQEQRNALTTGPGGEKKGYQIIGRFFEDASKTTHVALVINVETDGKAKIGYKNFSDQEYRDLRTAQAAKKADSKKASA